MTAALAGTPRLDGRVALRSATRQLALPEPSRRRFGTRALRHALACGEFEPYLQPLVTADGIWNGAEILMRWAHPLLGVLPPAEFIADLKTDGLLGAATEQILLKTARNWDRSAPVPTQPFRLAFNVSPYHLTGAELLVHCHAFRRICNRPDIQLVAEMPEHDCDLPPAQCRELMARLMQNGIQVAVDDFGVGDCRMHLLATGAVSYLKIDRSFVNKVGRSARYENLLGALTGFAHGLDIKTLAEGVETHEQRDILDRLGIDLYQGYLFAKPMPCTTFMEAMTRHEANTLDI